MLMRDLTKYRYEIVDPDTAWELLFGDIIPKVQKYLRVKYSDVYREKIELDNYFEFYRDM